MADKKNLYQKIGAIRDMCGAVQRNKEGFNFTYADLSQLLSVVDAGLSKHHVTIYPKLVPDTTDIHERSITKKKYDKFTKQTYDEVTTEFVVTGELEFHVVDEDDPTCELVIPWLMTASSGDNAQAFGSALTYTTRQFLLRFFMIATPESAEDVDAWVSKKKETERKDEIEAAKDIVAQVDVYLKGLNLSDAKKKEFADALKETRIIKENGRVSANYLSIDDVATAKSVMTFVNNYFNKEE